MLTYEILLFKLHIVNVHAFEKGGMEENVNRAKVGLGREDKCI